MALEPTKQSEITEGNPLADDDNAIENREMFNHILYPDDMYKNDIYYGDMSSRERNAFIYEVESTESKKEFGQFLAMFKRNPISPVVWYFKNCVLPGAGLGLEGYVLLFACCRKLG